jgi:Zn2+/Cd2+-exporting ATPase
VNPSNLGNPSNPSNLANPSNRATAVCTVCQLHAESTFRIEGMDCREEVALIERRFKNLKGVEDFSADLMGQRLHVKYDAAKLNANAIAGAIADAGMRAWLEHEEPIASGESASRMRTWLLTAAGSLFAGGLLAKSLQASPILATTLFACSMAAGVPMTARRAWQALRVRSLDINVLMLIAAAGAIVLGQWNEAAAVVFLFAVAQMLEARTLERARLAVRALMDLTPAEALVRDAQGERKVPVESVQPGTVIVIKPGEKVALDGTVVTGFGPVNQAPITGESLPIDKAPGDEVFAGSINGRSALEIRVTRYRRDTTLARIIHLVEQAQAQRAPVQSFVERFARIYTPAVIALAVGLAVIPPLVLGSPWQTWAYRALVLLVVSCPCALVISTPVSIVAALAGAARKGVLIKGGAHLERASRIRCVAFDKTGTLTRGVPEVVDVVTLNGVPAEGVVALAAAIEHRSEHPIAHAVLRYAAASHLVVAPASDVASLAGRGAEGLVVGAPVILGNHRLFEERGLCSPEIHTHLDAIGARGRTPVLVARNGAAVGIIAIADRARESSRDAIAELRRHGIEAVVMLTGDSQATAQAVAHDVGVDEFRAELMPEDKVEAIADLRRRFGSVAMVGDGVNDAPALASADIGIAMGAAGSDAALETADVALMADELMKIPYALRLSRTTLRNIKANLAISLALKAAFVVAAVAGVATLWMAILADTGASVIVIANALRLLRAD